jgi:hypothetical protein
MLRRGAVRTLFFDDADPVGPEDNLEAFGAEADRGPQVRDIATDKTDMIDQRADGAVFDTGDDSITIEFELDIRMSLRQQFAELALIRGDWRFAPAFTLKVEKAHERFRFAIIQFRLTGLFFRVNEIHMASCL